MTRILTIPEQVVELRCCEQCCHFHSESFLGLVPAFCSKEGRILTETLHNDGCGGPVGIGRTWHVIPQWCNIGEPRCKIIPEIW